jgi:predicted ArsR family transcriptional regulator
MSSDEARRVEHGALTARQVEVLVIVTEYYTKSGEACPARHVARQLEIYPEAVRGHFANLCRKGWLKSKSSPAIPDWQNPV